MAQNTATAPLLQTSPALGLLAPALQMRGLSGDFLGSQLVEERGEGEAELVRKALKRLYPNLVGWRLAGCCGQSKQEAAACREVPAARLPYPSGGSGSCWRQQRGFLPSQM